MNEAVAALPEAGRWWRDAVIYQVYPRSFADSDGDGVGDLAGFRQHLDYLSELGVNAIWLSPFYPSPMADSGYDVTDFRDVEPVFGTLSDADTSIADAHARGIRIIVDIVPNHCSVAHPWFQAAVLGGPGAPERARFWFRPGRGPDGDQPPNNWQSIFGGPAWTRVAEPNGSPGEWYLHMFDPGQPDFNWSNPEVNAEFLDILRFWFDRGVDGVRIDSAGMLVKDPLLADVHPDGVGDGSHVTDRPGVHDIYRQWRHVADSYPEPRALIGELWLRDSEQVGRYLAPGQLHTAFNFDYLGSAWDAASLRRVIDRTTATHCRVDAPATWVLSNHDTTRHVTRYGRSDSSFSFETRHSDPHVDLELGTRRARAAVLLTMALPGAVYVYQGEELGLWEVEDIPAAQRQDPMFHRSGGVNPGRDGCRVPLPWSGMVPPFGFSPAAAATDPWLPQPAAWSDYTVHRQAADPASMLTLYRTAIRLRRSMPALGERTSLTWLTPAEDDTRVLTFRRGANLLCVVNLSADYIELPPHEAILLTSEPVAAGRTLRPDTAAWLTVTVPD
jgi:alpha-glucosidase